MNSTLVSDKAKYYVSLWYCTLCFFGFTLDSLVLFTIIKLKRSNMTSFYIFLCNLCFSESCLFLLYAFYAVPCIIASKLLYGVVDDVNVMSLFQGVIFYTIALNNLFISVNRFICVCFQQLEKRIFPIKFSCFLIIVSWPFCLFVVWLNYLGMSCLSVFLEQRYIFSVVCNGYIPASLDVGSFLIYICTYGMAVFYAITIWKIWKRRKQVQPFNNQITENMTKYQMNTFYQALVIWLALLSNVLGRFTYLIM